MSTRRLILTALVCGFAILAAGAAFFARLVRHRGELTVDSILAVGQPARVGDAAVTVRSSRVAGGQLQVVVTVDRGAAPAGGSSSGSSSGSNSGSAGGAAGGVSAPSAEAPWSLVQGALRAKVAPAGAGVDVPACSSLRLDPGRTVTCVVAFTPGTGPAFAAFEWQGAHGRWRL